jgi:hypothetical protein
MLLEGFLVFGGGGVDFAAESMTKRISAGVLLAFGSLRACGQLRVGAVRC